VEELPLDRAVAEKEYYNFVAAEGAYRGLAAAQAFLEFVDRVESAIASENAACCWKRKA
jgi:hypothetical protein